MVDRVYKAQIPALRKALEELNRGFSNLNLDTKWNKLRVEPLLIHVRRLEELLKSDHSARLTKGVRMYHSDLVYLRDNVSALKQILQSEKGSIGQRGKRDRTARGYRDCTLTRRSSGPCLARDSPRSGQKV